jgi:hypothetical protein
MVRGNNTQERQELAVRSYRNNQRSFFYLMLADLHDRWVSLTSIIPAPFRWLLRGFFHVAGRLVAVLAVLAIVAFMALYIKLRIAPVSMTRFVEPIENAVNRTLTGMRFDIGDAVLRTSEDTFGIELRLTQVRLINDDNDRIVESPFATASVSLSALLRGHLAARKVELIKPQIYLQYSEEKGLALSFGDPQASKSDLGAAPQSGNSSPSNEANTYRAPLVLDEAATPAPVISPHAKVRALNITKIFHKAFAATRRGESAFLTTVGIRDATVYFDRSNEITTWRVPELNVYLEHARKNSAVSGEIAVDTPEGQWQMDFRIHQNQRSRRLNLSMSVNDVIPNTIANNFPSLYLPKIMNLPVSVAANFELTGPGDIMAADLRVKLNAGELYAPWNKEHPARIDYGLLHVTYSREEGKITILPSELQWGKSYIKISGGMKRQPATGHWAFQFASKEITLGAEEFGIPAIPLDHIYTQGNYSPRQGIITLDRFLLQAADAQIILAGDIARGARSPAIRLNGQISRMPVAFMKLIWPVFIGGGAREWIGEQVPTGRITGGTLKVNIPADLLAAADAGANIPSKAVDFRLNLEDLVVHYYKQLPALHISRATASISGQRFFLVAPRGKAVMPSGKHIFVTDGKFIIGDLRPKVPEGEIHFKTQSTPGAVLELLDHEPLHYISELNIKLPKVSGLSTGTFSLALPLLKDVRFKDMKVNGRNHVDNVRAVGLPGGFSVQAGAMDFDLSEKALEARGNIQMDGMPVAVNWQRIFDAAPNQQPPLRLRTVLSEAARDQLGLPVNRFVRGSVGAELQILPREDGPPQVRFEANLIDADIMVSALGWRKKPGMQTLLTFDIESLDDGGIRLANMNLSGNDISANGNLLLDANRKPVSFQFPKVALHRQTDLVMEGQHDATNNRWDIKATGTSFDGQQFFRSLFSAGRLSENQPPPPKDAPDIDVKVDLEKVIGFFDTSVSKVSIQAQRRNGKISFLNLHSRLSEKDIMAARVEQDKDGPRMLLVESTNAGAVFRLVGFYPSARGGQMTLKVNLDGSGYAEKEGILSARKFAIVNDTVMGEVVSGSHTGKRRPRKRPRQAQQAQYERFDFDSMRIPFSVGYGQFVLHEGLLKGPAMGVTLRGKLDFKNERMNLSGTYTPIYALNNIVSVVPILGDILTGRDGEGMFAISFTVQGSMDKPNIQVNPLSPLTPGFTRQIMEDPSVPRITPPEKRSKNNSGNKAQTSSQEPATQ